MVLPFDVAISAQVEGVGVPQSGTKTGTKSGMKLLD